MDKVCIIFLIGLFVIFVAWNAWISTSPPGYAAWHLPLIGGLLLWGALCLFFSSGPLDLLVRNPENSASSCALDSQTLVLEQMDDGNYYETYQDKTIIRVKTAQGDVTEIFLPRDKVTYRNTKDKAMVSLSGTDSSDEEMEFEKAVIYLPSE